MASDRDKTHAALTRLYESGDILANEPAELTHFFDSYRIAELAKIYMARQTDVTAEGRAVVVSAGPPGAGKTEALASLHLQGYRRIDPDIAKDLLLTEANRAKLLDFRRAYTLPDGKTVGLRELAPLIHKYSTQVTDVVRGLALNAGENVIIDGTLSWTPLVENYIDEFNRAGYEDVDVVAVEAPLDVALNRVKQRWWFGRVNNPILGGRFLSESHIRALYENPEESKCASNADALADLACEELGQGNFQRFDVTASDGKPRLTSARGNIEPMNSISDELHPSMSPEEVPVQIEIVDPAWTFLQSFYSGDLISAWEVTHPVLRLCLAQWWVDANQAELQNEGYSVAESAESLAGDSSGEHTLWGDFARVVLRDFREAYPLDVDSAGMGASHRPIALDTELLYVHPTIPANGLWQPSETREVYPLVMRLADDQWQVLNWASDAVPTPGYPPTLGISKNRA